MNTPAKKKWTVAICIVILAVIAGWYLFKKEIGSVSIPSKNDQASQVKNTIQGKSVPYLTVPDGFGISIFAKDVPDARTMLLTNKGVLVTDYLTEQEQIQQLRDR